MSRLPEPLLDKLFEKYPTMELTSTRPRMESFRVRYVVDIMQVVFSILGAVGTFVLLVLLWLNAPVWFREWSENALLAFSNLLFSSIDMAVHLIDAAVHLFHWLGRLFVVVIFMGAAITLSDNIANIFDIKLLHPDGSFFALTRLFSDRVTWVAVTAIVASTVAMGHFRTLDLNYEKHRKEMRDKLRESRSSDRSTKHSRN